MDLYSQFATDEALEIGGAWVKSPDKKGEFLIARAQNRPFQRLLTELVDDAQEILEKKDKDADACSDDIMASVMSETILLGWRGDLSYKVGEPLGDYTKARAKEVLGMKEFRKWVNKKSDDLDNYRVKAEAAQGNV